MKRSKLNILKNASLIAVGLVLARGAQATTLVGDTDLTFDNLDQPNNTQIPVNFGSDAATSSTGVVTDLGGTPDIGLTFVSTSTGHAPVQFQSFTGGPWNAAELFNSLPGLPAEEIIFTPTSFASVTLNSFNFHPYYTDGNSYNYTVSVEDVNTSTVLVSKNVIIPDTSTKQLVTLDAEGGLGDTLVLSIVNNGSTGQPGYLAIDDPSFTELVPEPGTIGLLGAGLGAMVLGAVRRKKA